MSKTAAPAWGLSRPPGFNRLTSQCHSGFVPFRGVLVSGQAKGAKHHGGALQANGELVHQTDGKASTSTVEDGLSPQPALVFRRGAPSARHRKKSLASLSKSVAQSLTRKAMLQIKAMLLTADNRHFLTV